MLLSNASLREAIRRAVGAGDISCAVAFWGRGAEDWIGPCEGRKVRLICNLRMGGTNPDVIADLIKAGADVRQSDRLHAKVYIGTMTSVVTSANASINGLGIEGDELAGWIETGLEVSPQATQPWFDTLWAECKPISDEDIRKARGTFRERAIAKPSRGTFAAFHPTKDDFPYVGWVVRGHQQLNKQQIERTVGRVDKKLRSRIDDSISEHPEDMRILQRGQWVLYWMMRANGLPDKRAAPWWFCVSGETIRAAVRYDNERRWRDVILPILPPPPLPFDATEPRFQHAFVEVMSGPDFADLRQTEHKGGFYNPRRKTMWKFWQTLRQHYV